MKHADGGFRPRYNVQAVVDVEAQILVDVAITQKGTDYDEIGPALDRVEDRFNVLPDAILADGGYAKKSDIEDTEDRGVQVYTRLSTKRTGDASVPRRDDGPGVAEWRKRMSEPDAAVIYKQRTSTIETCFGDMKEHRTLRRLPTRGLGKALSIVMLNALTYNFVSGVESILAQALSSALTDLQKIDVSKLDAKLAGSWKKTLEGTVKAMAALRGAQDLKGLRAGFGGLSVATETAWTRFGHAGKSPLYVFECSKASPAGAARWVQATREPDNPYLGSKEVSSVKLLKGIAATRPKGNAKGEAR